MDTINLHIVSLGGKVEVKTDFDPSKYAKSSTTGERLPPGILGQDADKYDPTKVINTIDQLKRERASQLEGKIENKDVKIFNTNAGTGKNLKQLLFEIDQKE